MRPETAQAMFVQFANCQQTTSMKIPFGIAQMGKSFRNEITTEKFIFRSCEFEQMEMEYFVEPGTQKKWLEYWLYNRLDWWKSFANYPEKFKYLPIIRTLPENYKLWRGLTIFLSVLVIVLLFLLITVS